MPRFFLPQANIHERRGIISGTELDHLAKVLRLREGDAITVFDDQGWEHEAIILALSSERGEIEIQNSYRAERESSLQITLGLGLSKGEKMDFVVEKATELGVHAIIPFTSEFTVPKFDARKVVQRTERWRKIALSATKQCGRSRVPAIEPLMPFSELLQRPFEAGLKILFWEKERHRSLKQMPAAQERVPAIMAVVGAEGGFSPTEVDAAVQRGFLTVGVGRRILRAETAAVAALTLVQFVWGDLG